MTMSILSLLLVAFYYIQIVASRVEGPFALYTKSADPAYVPQTPTPYPTSHMRQGH